MKGQANSLLGAKSEGEGDTRGGNACLRGGHKLRHLA